MNSAYLLFDLLVVSGPAVLGSLPGPTHWSRRTKALMALLVGGAPWVVWDLLAAGVHWDFNARFVLGPQVGGLPLEEWGFFLVVPYACLYCWERVVMGPSGVPRALTPWVVAAASLVVVGGIGAWVMPPYTALAIGSTGVPFALDLLMGTRVFHNPRAWAWLALVAFFTLLFNNVLTGMPIVVYEASAQLDVRLLTMPIEDLGFGLGHLGTVLLVYERLRATETECTD